MFTFLDIIFNIPWDIVVYSFPFILVILFGGIMIHHKNKEERKHDELINAIQNKDNE